MRLVFHTYTAFPVYGANASDKNKKIIIVQAVLLHL